MPRTRTAVCVGAEQLAEHLAALMASHAALLHALKGCLEICEREHMGDIATMRAVIAQAESR